MGSKNKTIKILVELSRIGVGATFVFSGFVKAVDPLGFTYKIQDYLIELNLTGLFPLALPVAVCLVVAEFLLGVFLLLGIYRKWTTILTGVFMAFFTPFTLWIALANPVEDCGCFGDAFIISNWQTFYKNIVLSVCTLVLIIYRTRMTPLFTRSTAWIAAAFSALFALLFALHNVYKLPVFDFRPYKIGANIPALMYTDPTKGDVYETVFIYSKDGVEKKFTEDNYPWNDSTWTFVDMKTNLVKEGEKPRIEDFSIEWLSFDDVTHQWNAGEDMTDAILTDSSYTFLMISYSLEDMHMKHLDRFKDVASYAVDNGYAFYCLTSSSIDRIAEWEKRYDTGFAFCHADERMLKTMIRSNPGLVLLRNGMVVNQWDDSEVPVRSRLNAPLDELDISVVKDLKKRNATRLSVIILAFIVPLALLKRMDVKRNTQKTNYKHSKNYEKKHRSR